MEPQIDSPEEFKRLLLEHVRLDGERRFQEFPQQALTWLAVAPAWPLRLAEQGFPVGDGIIGTGESVSSMMARTASAQLSESGDANEVQGGTTYWMNQSQRSFVINKVIEKNDRGLDYVRGELHNAGIAMSQAAEKGMSLSPPLLRWSELAKCVNNDERMVGLIGSMVDNALKEARRSNQLAAPEALRWIEAAEPFARIFKGPLEVAVTRAGRKLELFHRRAYDARFLENYYVRQTQDDAFKELVDRSDSLWALHYVGLGGTGKTMLMRHISSQLAPSPEYNLAVARVDFDHLNPDYPSIRPGLLLTGLAEELRAYSDEFVSSSFRAFDRAILTLHEKIRGEAGFGAPSGVSLNDPAFIEALELFIVELNNLWRHGKRPLLILDTCEELAKIRPDGKPSDSVRVTFEILEYIHERALQMRVVFSGRRPLAWSGHNWVFSTKDVQESKDVVLEDHREYLRLHEIRGFTRDDALNLLKRFKKTERIVDPALFEAILDQSNASDQTFDSRFEFTGASTPIDSDPRYNPFDLDMYASWSCDDETLDAKKLEKGAHYYVRERIVDRAHYLLKRYLPEIVLLGRFDRDIMRELIVSSGGQFDVLFPELIDQEWIDVDRVADQSATVWAMDNVMRKRLLNYYADNERSTLNSATTNVASFLYDLTLKRDWRNLTAAYFDSALRTLSSNKVKAAEWWSKVEAKLAETGEWAWAMTLTDLLLAEGGPVARADVTAGLKPEQESVLRPAVLATRAAALTHLKPLQAKNVWLEVLEKADRHPTTAGVPRLKFRAMAGIIADLRLPESAESAPAVIDQCLKTIEQMPPDWALSDAQSAASLLAMLEGLTELFERIESEGETAANAGLARKASNLYRYFEEHVSFPGDLPGDLQTFFTSLDARLDLAAGQVGNVDKSLEKVPDQVGSLALGSVAQPWLDWHRPDDLPSRIRLQYIRAMYPAYLDAESILKRVGAVPATLTNLDADRLASAMLCLRNCIAVPPTGETFDDDLERSLSLRSVIPSCNLHRDVAPYFVSFLKTRAASGSIDEVVRKTLNISKEAETKGDTRTQQAADRLMSRLGYRMRLRDERSLAIGGSTSSSNLLEDIDVRFILAALDGAKSTDRLDGYLRDESLDINRQRHAVLAHIGWRTGRPLVDLTAGNLPSSEGDLSFHELLRSLNSIEFERSEPEPIDPPSAQPVPNGAARFPDISFETFSLFLDGVEASHDTSPTRRKVKDSVLLNAWDAWATGHPTEPVEAVTLYVRAASLTLGGVSRATESKSRQTRLDQLAKGIGMRRAAGVALEEGTLLALRLPQYARVAYELASRWFMESADGLGSLLANMCLSMLYAKLQDGTALRLQLEPTRADYIICAASVPALPGWDKFFEGLAGGAPVSSAQLTEFLDSLEGSCWRPWLVRLTGCLIRYREFDAPGDLTNALRGWVEKNYSAVIDYAIRIPAEFDSSFLYAQSASFGEHRSERPWQVRFKEFVSRNQNLFYASVGLALAFAGFFGFMRLVSYLLELTTGSAPGFWWNLLLTLVIIIALSQMPGLFKWYRALFFRFFEQILIIDNDGPVPDPNRPLQFTTRISSRARMLGFLGPVGKESIFLEPAAAEQYRALPEIIPEKLRQNLARNHRWLGEYFANTALSVNERNAAAPWEAVFGLVQQKDTGLEENRWLFRRTVDTQTSPSLDPILEPVRILSWAPDLSQVDVARTSWRNDKLQSPRFSYSGEKPVQQIQAEQKEVNVLHLIGTPVEALSGIRLEIGEAELTSSREYKGATSSSNWEQAGGGSTPDYERGFLVRADELPLRFSNLRVCIIQGATLPEETPRTSAQRFEASKLRRFGADLSKCGVACVILLPPTTREISIELVGQIAELVSQGSPRVRHWMKTVRAIQEIIAARGHTDGEAALEMALDVCVYMVDGFRFRTERPESTAGN